MTTRALRLAMACGVSPLCSSSKTDTSSSRSSVRCRSPTWSKRLPPLCNQQRKRMVLKKIVMIEDVTDERTLTSLTGYHSPKKEGTMVLTLHATEEVGV